MSESDSVRRAECGADVSISPEAVASRVDAAAGHVRPVVGANTAGQPTWYEPLHIEPGSIEWKVMTRGFYWVGRRGAVRYVVTYNNPITDGYHVIRAVAQSPYLRVQAEEADQVVADLQRWLRAAGAYVPGIRSIFGSVGRVR